jgi:arabinofuranosyltransferase
MQIGYSPGPRVAQGMDLRLFAVIVCVVATRLVAYLIFPVYDDAFITFRYSANLADGFGFVYHPGESVLGTTAPGFGLIVAGLMALGADPEVLVPFVNIVLDVAIVILTARLLMDSAGDFAALGFGLIYAAMPLAGRITVGGMEANTFLLTCIAA